MLAAGRLDANLHACGLPTHPLPLPLPLPGAVGLPPFGAPLGTVNHFVTSDAKRV